MDRVYLQRRIGVAVGVTLAAILAVLGARAALHGRGSGPSAVASPRATGSARSPAPARSSGPAGPAVLTVTPTSWVLPSPLSRAVALQHGTSIRLLGGLGPNNATSPAVVDLDPSTGAVSPVGSLAVAVHDAGGAVLGGQDVVFGGGAVALTADAQGLSAAGPAGPAHPIGTLPAPRADLSVAMVGGQAVIVGGYDGQAWSPEVLATSDGVSFRTVAALPDPVRYPAVVASGQKVFVVGGELANGADSTAIQVVDLAAGTAAIAGSLTAGLSHAAGATIGGNLYVFGGRSGGQVTDTVSQLDPATASLTPVARMPVALSDMAVVASGSAGGSPAGSPAGSAGGSSAWLLGGENQGGTPVASVAEATLGPAPAGRSTPFDGQLLIADRGNNRLLLVTPAKTVTWTFPSAAAPAPAQGFYFPDDAFFAKHGTAIITNEEDQDTIIELSYPTGTVIESYGHSKQPGSAPGFLNQPDDAYVLPDGSVTVADALNCRILFLTPQFTYGHEIGTDRACQHNPPTDIGYPNGDTPLANGDILVSEIHGSYIDELRPDGTVVWTLQLPIAYPSDPQQLGPDLYLVADYSKPGGIYEFTREGTIVWSYAPASGHAALDHPSLAERLPSGLICANDDYRARVVCIDPITKAIVWQYGVDDTPGTAPGLLNLPDGFDLLAPDGSTPTHPQTG